MNIGITGATGLIGGAVGQLAAAAGHQVVAYTRSPAKARLPWAHELRSINPTATLPLDASGLECLIHLAGESILGLWTEAKKALIRDSRVDLTRRLVRCIAEAAPRPRSFICASGTGFYGDQGDLWLDESAPLGQDFLATVCRDWESAARAVEQLSVRSVHCRTGLVLSREGGAFPLMKRAFSLGLGGRLGDGQHYQPWIHIEDEARLILWAAETESISGPINLASPNPVTNAEFTRLLAKAVSRPAIFHAPAFVLKTALGGLGEALLCSQRAKPKVALDNGFNFAFTELGTAFQNLLSHPPAHS